MPDPKPPKKQPNRWLAMTSIALQMGLIIYLGAWGGRWLDEKYSDGGKTYTLLLTLAAIVISLYLVIKQTKRLNP